MDRVIVITGASSGIGAALAEELGGQGDRLVLAARRADELERVGEAATVRGAAAVLTVPTDVTDRVQVTRLRNRAIAAFGHVDVWVNNAGRGISRSVLQLTDVEVDQMFAVNFKSALYGCQAIAPHFIERNAGHIINVSSFLGRVPIAPIRSVYAAAKAAVNTMTACLRMDLATQSPGVHVSLVVPGVVQTDFAANVVGGPPPTPPAAAMAGLRAQSAEEAAQVIAQCIEQPVAEVYTNLALAEVVARYYADVASFEASRLG